MAKLSKDQIRAIASKIINEMREVYKPHNDSIAPALNNLIESKITGTLREYYDNASHYRSYVINFIKEKYKAEFDALPRMKTPPYQTNVEDDIIIATIGEPDIAQIINSIKAKYLGDENTARD